MIPVIVLTGYLGAGKTSLLNGLLTRPGTRVGVIINDIGKINVDTGLITGQIDAAESIAGGCVCCLPDSGGLDELLEKLAAPKLRLDAIIVEASGAADPINVDRLLRYGNAPGVRPGGIIDVIDAVQHEHTVDTAAMAPARFTAASLVVVNKLDMIPEDSREETFKRISNRVREANPQVTIVPANHAAIDPELVFDIALNEDPVDELPLAAASRAEHDHVHAPHAHAVTVPCGEAADPGAVLDLLENPPANAYRLKGHIKVRTGTGMQRYLVNMVGSQLHFAPATAHSDSADDALVAVGMHLDEQLVGDALRAALAPASVEPTSQNLTRLERRLILSTGAAQDQDL
ncbi:GTP-binding protein [Glutamicibacter sp. M10]|uniref:CobW family GTP-binding protein n=1 Tax=Glutamicibacter sp. M10 TaxID=3023076 RepID=UPI0021C5DE60|nr:GTP-binding protein [Glutamicibacter sp. M10]UXN32553.1 GTP-binding protein [Glutamicibacter sp. M10]